MGRVKTVLVGDSFVGKTCLLNCLVGENFVQSYSATVGVDFKARCVTGEGGDETKLTIWDAGGKCRCAAHYGVQSQMH